MFGVGIVGRVVVCVYQVLLWLVWVRGFVYEFEFCVLSSAVRLVSAKKRVGEAPRDAVAHWRPPLQRRRLAQESRKGLEPCLELAW